MVEKSRQKLRIIGGRLRGRKLEFLTPSGLRPTPDRIRETLFNWLAPYISGMNCLDCFAGSGILSFEALSRGAKHITVIEKHRQQLNNIKKYANEFGVQDNINYICASMPEALEHAKVYGPFDLVFLDPPYKLNLLLPSLSKLLELGLLNKNAFIYMENYKFIEDCDITDNISSKISLHRQVRAGQVCAMLYAVT